MRAVPTLPARDTSEEEGEIPLLARSQTRGESAGSEALPSGSPAKDRNAVTLRRPQGALARGAPQESTELGAQQHHTSLPTDAGGPFILTLSRGKRRGKPSGNTRHTEQPADPEPHRAPWQGAAHPRSRLKHRRISALGPCPPPPPENEVKGQVNSKFTDQRGWPNPSARGK